MAKRREARERAVQFLFQYDLNPSENVDEALNVSSVLMDRYLEFVAGRARPNTLRAVAFDLKAFFTVVAKDPVAVAAADVFEFLAHQRGDRTVLRLADRESGLSARTIARRLSSVSGFTRTWWPAGTRRCWPIRCRVACRPGARADRQDRGWCRWCGCRGPCRGFSSRRK
jgi:hypothetical protein